MNTYTYTARSANDPQRVLTFTLDDQSMSIDLGAPVELIEGALGDGGDKAGSPAAARSWLKPVAVSLLEHRMGPFKVADVRARARGGGLQVTAWMRIGGLRLAPVLLGFERVDNPEGARRFVRELEERRAAAAGAGTLVGPFDYWGGWLAAGLLAAGALLAVWWRQSGHAE